MVEKADDKPSTDDIEIDIGQATIDALNRAKFNEGDVDTECMDKCDNALALLTNNFNVR